MIKEMKHLRMQRLKSFTFWVVLALAISSGCQGCLMKERMALLQLKASLNFPNSISSVSWQENDTKTSCCKWDWVECSQRTRHVIKINFLHARELQASGRAKDGWYLNASTLLRLKSLVSLDLSSTNLNGWVENDGVEKLSSLRNLQYLNVGDNSVNRSFLPLLNQLSNLRVLRIYENKLTGSIDLNDFHGLNNLKELDLGSNKFNNITAYHDVKSVNYIKELSSLTNLEALHLSQNYFNNRIFSSLSGLQSLKILQLSNNQLKGSISLKEFHGLNNLKELDLSFNKLNSITTYQGPKIVNFTCFHTSLKTLQLTNNQLKGSISLKGFKSLEELDISGNQVDSLTNLGGFKSCSKLQVLCFSGSKFNASKLLQSLGSFSSLKTLDMHGSIFQGRVTPQVLRNLTQVQELFIDQCLIDESFIESIGAMTSLKLLSTYKYDLHSSLHQGFCQLKNLEVLDLKQSNFEGTIPSCFKNLSSLIYLDISENKLQGNIALSPLKSLTSLEFLALSDNFFQIPLSFGTFANHSKLDFFTGGNNDLVVESLSPNLVFMFQPKVLDLKNCRLEKPLKPFLHFLYNQHDLRTIDLSHISLGGKFLSWLLRNNTGLKHIRLRNNSFVGPLDLPSNPSPLIRIIDFSQNHLQGQVPANMSSLFPNLFYLNLSSNDFFGNIFLSFKKMNYLGILDLSNNNFSGIMPQHLVMDFPSLVFLKLSSNKFQGKICPELFSDNLQSLYLDGNNFTGEMPTTMSSNYMTVLDLSDNHFIGKLPSWIGNTVIYLEEISMSNNNFHGAIPIGFCNLNNLSFLDLSENNLSGVVPSCFNLPNIKHVHLQRNSLQGDITHAFWNSSSLVTLDLRENHFSGQIPKWTSNLSTLSVVLLKANHFSGEVPIQLCYLRALSILDLSQNNFSGLIPSCLSSIPFKADFQVEGSELLGLQVGEQDRYFNAKYSDLFTLHSVDVEDFYFDYVAFDPKEELEFTTKWKSYSYKGKILNLMSGIDLSCNQLTGEIPSEIGDISAIHALNLSFNNLTGSIPISFSNLKQLESLDLSHNNLNGTIPSQIIELNFLEVFSVAYNNLSGPTPDKKAQFETFTEDSYEGNPFLCGPPLQKKCDETQILDPLNGHDGEDTSFIDMDVFYVSFVATYTITLLGISIVLCINPYWRRAWFYCVEIYATTFYYFVKDHFPKWPFPK